jgi:uncharacterized membrane protein
VKFPGQLHDIKAAIRWLRANAGKYNLDGNHIGIVGDSSGGWTSAMAAFTGDAPETEGSVGTVGVSSRVEAAIAFYLLFVAGIVVLAVWPAVERQSLAHALVLGALLGLVTYAAYDLTNLATLEGFPLKVALVDLAWGTVLCATVSAVTFRVSLRLI